MNEEKQVAVVAVEILGEYVTSSLMKMKLGKEGYAFALNKDGVVVAHPDKTKLFQLNVNLILLARRCFRRRAVWLNIRKGRRRFPPFRYTLGMSQRDRRCSHA